MTRILVAFNIWLNRKNNALNLTAILTVPLILVAMILAIEYR